MNADELDDLARWFAGAPMSRRAALKAAAAAAIMAPFLDIARRTPEGNARPGAHPLGVSPVCDWSSAGLPCVGALGGTILTAAACAAVESVITAVKCVTGITGAAAAWKACGEKLNCQCPAGSVICEDKYTDTDCCGIGEVCVHIFGCMPPCGPCQEVGPYTGECGPCLSTHVCCNGSCVDTQSDPSNCGSCGSPCPAGYACCAGTCNDTQGGKYVCCDNALIDPEFSFCCPGTNYHACNKGPPRGYCCPTLCSSNPCQ